ncbi:MAG: hypothetical protein ACRD9L_25770, partial [Bryobacteraceae bacterium]
MRAYCTIAVFAAVAFPGLSGVALADDPLAPAASETESVAPPPPAATAAKGWLKSDPAKPADSRVFLVKPGTHIPLSMINSISTKNASEGDRVYLETVFPILVNGRMV